MGGMKIRDRRKWALKERREGSGQGNEEKEEEEEMRDGGTVTIKKYRDRELKN